MPAETSPGVPTPSVRAHDDALSSRIDGAAVAALSWHRAQCSASSCVEVARLPDGGAAIRDSKSGAAGPVLFFGSDEWQTFTTGVKDGDFD